MSTNYYVTKDNGRLHIAADEYYQGSTNSYNNFLTRAFTKLFGVSTNVTMNGKTRCVNKKSYVKLLQHLGAAEASPKTLDNYKDFNAIQFNVVKDRGLMREHLTAYKTDKLGKKLVNAIVHHDDFLTQKALGKGAKVNQHFWIRGYDNRIVFDSKFTPGLPHMKINPFKATQFTPFLLAVSSNNQALASILKKYGANSTVQGQEVTFSRELIMAQNNVSFVPTYQSKPYPHLLGFHHHGYNKHHHNHGHLGMDMVTKQTLTFVDTYANAQTLAYHEPTKTIHSIATPQMSHQHQWSEDNLIGVTKIL